MSTFRPSSSSAYRLVLVIGFGTLTWVQWFVSLVMGVLCFPALVWVAYESASRDWDRRRAYRCSVSSHGDENSSKEVGHSLPTPSSLWISTSPDRFTVHLFKYWIISVLCAAAVPVLILIPAATVFYSGVYNIFYFLIGEVALLLVNSIFIILSGCAIAAAIWSIQGKLIRSLESGKHVTISAETITEKRAIGRRVVEAFEIERQRIERDLHDGAQQFLVASNMKIGEALMLVEFKTYDDLKDVLIQAQHANDEALSALRRTVAGVHPQVLTDRGLGEAVADVVAESPVSTRLMIPHPLPPMPSGVSAAAYFLVCEALTNIAKYAPQAEAVVTLVAGSDLVVSIVDNGPGGAAILPGHGLSGLAARLQAFGGDLSVSSPLGGPTEVRGSLPLLLMTGESGVVLDKENDVSLRNEESQEASVSCRDTTQTEDTPLSSLSEETLFSDSVDTVRQKEVFNSKVKDSTLHRFPENGR